MKFGIGVPTGAEGMYLPSQFAGPEDIVKVTRLAERLGFFSIWAADFLTHTPTMGIKEQKPPNFYEVMISMAYLGSVTSRIKLGVGAIALPLRDPVLLAKQAATLDVFTGGRLLLGVGIGAYRDQFEYVMPRQSKAHRATMMLEGLQILRSLFTQDNVSFKGRYYEFHDLSLNPKPKQKPLPIYISGRTVDTPQRVARWGDGWLLSRVQDISVRERISQLSTCLQESGRDLASIDLVMTKFVSIARTHEEAVKRFDSSMLPERTRVMSRKRGMVGSSSVGLAHARDLIGSPEEIYEKVASLQEEGVTHCVALHFAADTFGEMLEQVHLFGEEVVAKFKGKDILRCG